MAHAVVLLFGAPTNVVVFSNLQALFLTTNLYVDIIAHKEPDDRNLKTK